MTFNKTTLATLRPRFSVVQIEGLGSVRLQSLSQKDYYDIIELTAKTAKAGKDAQASADDPMESARMLRDLYPVLVAYAVIDDDGARVFTGPDDPDLCLLRPTETAAIGNAAYEFWGFTNPTPIETEIKN